MKSIIELLNEKNQFLEKFYRLNEVELERFTAGEFENLEHFYASRDGILEMIKKLDEKIEVAEDIPSRPEDVTSEMKKSVMGALQYKNDLVNRILEQDLRILSAIESEKSQIIKELSAVRTARKAIGSYKSGNRKSRLDEKA